MRLLHIDAVWWLRVDCLFGFLVYDCGFLGELDDCFLCLLDCFVVML